MSSETYDEAFERQVAAYLELRPAIILSALNCHYKGRGTFNQTKFFDLDCLTEALRHSPIDASKILPEEGEISMKDGPFGLEYKGYGSQKSDWKIVPNENSGEKDEGERVLL